VPIIILPMHAEDTGVVAKIHAQAFSRQHSSEQWISSNFAAFPRIMIFVARDEQDKVIGYIQWIHKSGFRQDTVIELEQIAVLKTKQHQGIATKLIQESLTRVKDHLRDNQSVLKSILISTRSDNHAQELYKKVLGAQVIATLTDLYSADEVLMLAKSL
jgi:ribosomal protein S18 acetylase RimI-like enzyme